MYSKRLWPILLLIGFTSGPLAAQNTSDLNDTPHLHQITQIDFDQLAPEAGEIVNGRVFVDRSGEWLAVANRDGQILLFDAHGELLAVSALIDTPDAFPATFIDGAFDKRDPFFAALHSGGDHFYLSLITLDGSSQTSLQTSTARPVALWSNTGYVWLEMLPDDAARPPFLLRFPVNALGPTGGRTP
jgi:hypothetical protein